MADSEKLEALFRLHNKRLTPTRKLIYDTLASSDEALTMQDIELLADGVDKSTVSRTLHVLGSIGAVHRITDANGLFKFAVTSFEEGMPLVSHIHFSCMKCGKTYCVESVHIPPIHLPDNFKATDYNIVVTGICPYCH